MPFYRSQFFVYSVVHIHKITAFLCLLLMHLTLKSYLVGNRFVVDSVSVAKEDDPLRLNL